MSGWNKDTTSIIEWYQKFNELYFNNELPETVPVKWTKSNKALGSVRTLSRKIDFTTREVTIKLLAMSSHFDFTEKQFKSTLLHEMVHIHNSVFDNYMGHGILFQAKCREIEKLSGIYGLYEAKDIKTYKLYGNVKEAIGIIAEYNDGKIVGSAFNKTALENPMALSVYLSQLRLYTKRFKFIKTTDRRVVDMRKKRKLKLGFYYLEEGAEELFNEPEYVTEVITKSITVSEEAITELKVA